MNFYQFDPIASHGIDVGAARRNPTIVPVRFRDIIRPEHYELFRWQFFRVHFQFVMANELPHAYDFFMIVCGPVPLERSAWPPPTPRWRSRPATGGARIRRGKGWKTQLRATPRAMPPIWANVGTIGPPPRLKNRAFLVARAATSNRAAPGWLWGRLWCKACGSMAVGSCLPVAFVDRQALQNS